MAPTVSSTSTQWIEGKPLAISDAVLNDGGVNNTIHFNRTIADTVKAQVFADKNFRIGMSYAINRPEIIEIVHAGQGTPSPGRSLWRAARSITNNWPPSTLSTM